MKTLYLKVKHEYNSGIRQFPSFSATGSIKGMKKQFYGDDALLVKCGSYIYNVSQEFYDDVACDKYK